MGIRSVDELQILFKAHGVNTIYVKHLSPKQDNDKNQVYVGGGFGDICNILPATIQERSKSESTNKRGSARGRPKVEGKLSLSWMDSSGEIYPAPNARIINYFQYPESRLSGFLNGCSNPPDSLRRTHQAKYGHRILAIGVAPGGDVIATVLTAREDPVVPDFPDLPPLPALPIFGVLTPDVVADPRAALIDELTPICSGNWYRSLTLRPGDPHPVPFRGNQGGGYTLEALLGVERNANNDPDKYGYEIKAHSQRSAKISLMTPAPDLGEQGRMTFRDFMDRFGSPGRKNGGSVRFTGQFKCGKVTKRSGLTLEVTGYEAKIDTFSRNVNDISVILLNPETRVVVAGWSFERMANTWNRKHASAAYVAYERAPCYGDTRHDFKYRYDPVVHFGEGTSAWKLLRAIARGDIYYDPAHSIYSDGTAKMRPQWRMSCSKLAGKLKSLYSNVEVVRLTDPETREEEWQAKLDFDRAADAE